MRQRGQRNQGARGLPSAGHKRAGCHRPEAEKLSAMPLKEAQQPGTEPGTHGACWRASTAQRASKMSKGDDTGSRPQRTACTRELYKALKGPVQSSVLTAVPGSSSSKAGRLSSLPSPCSLATKASCDLCLCHRASHASATTLPSAQGGQRQGLCLTPSLAPVHCPGIGAGNPRYSNPTLRCQLMTEHGARYFLSDS